MASDTSQSHHHHEGIGQSPLDVFAYESRATRQVFAQDGIRQDGVRTQHRRFGTRVDVAHRFVPVATSTVRHQQDRPCGHATAERQGQGRPAGHAHGSNTRARLDQAAQHEPTCSVRWTCRTRWSSSRKDGGTRYPQRTTEQHMGRLHTLPARSNACTAVGFERGAMRPPVGKAGKEGNRHVARKKVFPHQTPAGRSPKHLQKR
eukprot:scaffold921_cov318-Pavlova_lutheri.AAC.1